MPKETGVVGGKGGFWSLDPQYMRPPSPVAPAYQARAVNPSTGKKKKKDTINTKVGTGCSLNIAFFPYFVIFLNSASSAAALVFYLPGVCTHTDIERKQSPEYILKSSKKHNI